MFLSLCLYLSLLSLSLYLSLNYPSKNACLILILSGLGVWLKWYSARLRVQSSVLLLLLIAIIIILSYKGF
jgi:hypothetical protein